MLHKPDARVLSALAALEGDHNFKTILEWMEVSLAEIDRDTRTTKDEVLTRWSQGASQALAEFVGATKNARSAMNRAK